MATTLEINECITLMRGYWPNWKPSEQELQVVANYFKYYKFYDIKEALNKASFETNYNSPPKKTIKSLLNQRTRTFKTNSTPLDAIFIMCMEDSGGCKCKSGTFFKINMQPDKDPEKVRSQAIQRITKQYGGKWAIFEGCTEDEMIQNRATGRGYPLPEPGTNYRDVIKNLLNKTQILGK